MVGSWLFNNHTLRAAVEDLFVIIICLVLLSFFCTERTLVFLPSLFIYLFTLTAVKPIVILGQSISHITRNLYLCILKSFSLNNTYSIIYTDILSLHKWQTVRQLTNVLGRMSWLGTHCLQQSVTRNHDVW